MLMIQGVSTYIVRAADCTSSLTEVCESNAFQGMEESLHTGLVTQGGVLPYASRARFGPT